MRRFMMGLWAAVAVTALSIPAAWAEEEKVSLDQLPKVVSAAVKAKFPDAELKEAEKEEVDGKTIYEVSLRSKGHDYDVSLTPEGKIIEIEKVIAAKDLPAAVVKGLDQKYPKATIKLAEEISKDNTTNYEVIIETTDKKKLEVVLDATGKILKEEAKGEDEESEEEEIPLDKLPKTVVEAVKTKFPGAELKGAATEKADGKVVYEVVLSHRGQDIELVTSSEGKILAIEKTIKASQLPDKVSKALADKYPRGTVKKAEELIKDDKTSYAVVIETADNETLEIVFNPEGKVVEASAAQEGAASSQSLPADKVPANVREAFRAKFPGVSKVEWKLKADKNYEAEFKQKDVEVAVKFDNKGKWLETETAIEQSALPKAVRATISRDYKAYKIIETQTVVGAGDKPILFEVHLENGDEILKVQLEESGAIASKSSKHKNAP